MNAVPVCPAAAAECRCRLDLDHDGPHDCRDQEECGGRWLGTVDTDDFEIVRMPGVMAAQYGIGLSLDETLDALFPGAEFNQDPAWTNIEPVAPDGGTMYCTTCDPMHEGPPFHSVVLG